MSKVLIIGASRSGMGAAKLAKKNNEEIIIFDDKEISKDRKQELKTLNVEIFEKEFPESLLENVKLVVKSPGLSANHWLVEKISQKNIPIIGEIEYASRYTSATLIGITGSNGKTTTTALTHHILKNCGLNAEVAGNVGNSFAEAVINSNPDYFVLEISNLQLLDMYSVHFKYACITNITPDHLDVHKTMDHYVKTKFSILKNSTKNDLFFYNSADAETNNYLKNETLNLQKKNFIENLGKYKSPQNLVGKHNEENIAAASSIAEALGLDILEIQKAINSFAGVKHRIEFIGEKDGVKFYNDSKATNVDSAKVALEAFEGRIIWICGGIDKGNNYADIYDLVNKKAKKIICLTKHPERIIESFGKNISVSVTESVDQAVSLAKESSTRGDIVLLSPACASFDLFKDFEDRGEKFCEAVRKFL